MKVFLCVLALFAFAYSQSITCTACDFVVKGAEGLLANNLTESQIIHFLENGCALLPSPFSGECTSIVDTAGAAIIKDLIEGVDPEVVCTKFGFCGSKRAVSDVQQGGCSVCQLVVSYVESYLAQNQTEAQIIANLEQVCSLLGPLGSTCDQFVEQYVPQLIQWIEAGESPAVFCKQVGLCGSQKRSVADAQQAGCSVCQLVVSYVESYLAQNQTEAQIIANLEQVCSLLGPLGSTCDQFVEQYVPQLIQWIEAGESPAVFCKQVGLCGSNKVKRDVQQGGCSVCQLVVSYVESYLEQNQTEAQIIAQLEQVCSLLGPLASTCDQFVEQYVPQLIQWIEAGENPAVFCKQIGLCASSLKRDVQQGGCSVCQLVVSYVESYLAQNQTEAQIIANLEQVCSLLGPLGSTCDQFVEQYVPQLIQWIEAGESPAVFCKQVGLCSSSLKRDVEQSGGCSVCQLVVSYVENFLKSNGSLTQLEQELDQLCSLLGPLASTCDNFVALYTPQLVEWIINNEPPQAFCAQVGLCSAPSKVQKPKKVVATISKSKNLKAAANCGLCELVVQYVELYVAQSTTEKDIIASVEQLCTYLPASIERQCNSIVEANVPKLIQYLISKENPSTFCTQVGLCPQ